MKLDPTKMMARVNQLQQELQEKLEAIEESASSGGGMVTATCNGRGEVTRIRIDPEVVDPEEVELLEDLVRAAVAEAQNRARQRSQEELRGMLGPLPIPDLFGGVSP